MGTTCTTTTLRGLASLLTLVLLAVPSRADVLVVPTDAYPTIQSAADLALGGDVIRVKPGVYRENVRLATSEVTIRGPGATIDGGYAGPCLEIQADFTTVSGFTLVNGTVGLAVDGALPLITNVEVVGAAGQGMDLTGGPFRLGFNTVRDCRAQGIRLATTTPVFDDRSVLLDNLVSGCQSEGILATSSVPSAFLLLKNEVVRNGLDGIAVATTGSGPSRVESNVIRCNGRHGVFVNTADPVVTEANRCEENGGDGISGGTLVLCRRNVCKDNVGSGIDVQAADANHERNRTDGNGLYGLRLVINAAEGANGVIRHRSAGNGRDGLRLETTAGLASITVREANSRRNRGDGIDVAAAFTQVTITGSRCRDNGHEGIDNSGMNARIDKNVARGNIGADIAGAGKAGVGVVVSFDGNSFATGGAEEAQALDL